MKIVQSVNDWLDKKPRRRRRARIALIAFEGVCVGIVLAKLGIGKERWPVVKNGDIGTVVASGVKELPIPEIKKGIVRSFIDDGSGLPMAIVESGEFEFLDEAKTLCVSDLGEIGKAFVGTGGSPAIELDTPVDLIINFQNRA